MFMNKEMYNAVSMVERLTTNTYTRISDMTDLGTEYFLTQTMRKLKKAGLVEARSGPGGGYKLVNSEVSLYAISAAVDTRKLKYSYGPLISASMEVNVPTARNYSSQSQQ